VAEESRVVPRSCPGESAASVPVVGKVSKPVCYPEAAFVERLCRGTHPGVALVMFGKDSPWERAYLKGPTKAWLASPGAQSEEQLFFREEVLVLQGPEASSEYGVSQGRSFYALRWDGSCVKLNEEEVSAEVPWNKAMPAIPWDWLGDAQQEHLRANGPVQGAVVKMRKSCRGARVGKGSPECESLRGQLSQAIAKHVRSGAAVPDPENVP
jgi:hypothetical protein